MAKDIKNLDSPKPAKKPKSNPPIELYQKPKIEEPKTEELKVEEKIPITADICSDTDKDIGCYPGTIWQHYKGEIYQVVTTALHTEEKYVIVVYQNLKTRRVFARPACMWLEQARPGTQRFTFLREKL